MTGGLKKLRNEFCSAQNLRFTSQNPFLKDLVVGRGDLKNHTGSVFFSSVDRLAEIIEISNQTSFF
jgi:hypothetical protein